MGNKILDIDKSKAFLGLGRPSILLGGILAFSLGTAMGAAETGSLKWLPLLAGFLVTEAANLAAHYADEYADIDTDTLTRRTAFSGGSGILPAGLVPPSWALHAAQFLVFLTVILSVLFTARGWISVHAAVIALVGLVGGWFYSMKPLQLERRGLAEITNGFIGGFLMPLMGYTVQVGAPSFNAVFFLLPVFLIVTADLLGVHWPDRAADEAVGKRTLALILGSNTPCVYGSIIIFAYLLLFLQAGRLLPLPLIFAVSFAIPFNLWAGIQFSRSASPAPASISMGAFLLAATAGWIIS